jgi:hypothetical protein
MLIIDYFPNRTKFRLIYVHSGSTKIGAITALKLLYNELDEK